MSRRLWGLFAALIVVGVGVLASMSGSPRVAAQQPAARGAFPNGYVDPAPILAAVRRNLGADNLRCVTISGTAYDGALGQAKLSDKNVDWPRIDSLANYTRTMNWQNGTMKEEFDRKPGLSPAGWKYGIGWVDGPLQQNQHQTFYLNGTTGWYKDGPNGTPTAVDPDITAIWPVEMYLNPHGFLKAAAMPNANPKAVWRWELGEMGRDGAETPQTAEKMYTVGIMMGRYHIDATINKENFIQRVHTWVPNSVLGDMNYEHEFTNGAHIDVGNGIKFPTGWHSHEGWDDNFQSQSMTAGHNAFGGTMKDVKPNVCDDPVAIPDAVRTATFPVTTPVTRLADGVFLIGGSSANSVAVEFADYVAVYDAPINEKRSLAVIEEVARTIPNKPIRFVINSHQHFDHLGGLRTYWHIGATMITHWQNWAFYNHDVINYTPRTLEPDMLSMWPLTELAEGYNYELVRENYVLTDAAGRNLQIFYANPMQHGEGMLIAYVPSSRVLMEADIVDTDRPMPAQPTRDMTSLRKEIQTLKLNPATIVPSHGKPIPYADFEKMFAGAPKSNN